MLQDYFINIYLDSISNMVGQIAVSFEASSQDLFQSMAEQYAQDRTAVLVTKLDETTKDMLRNDLKSYMDQGLTPAEISIKLQDNYAFSESRAMNISRSETGFAWNHAGIMTAKTGGAKGVKVFDGDYDGACASANGQNWTFEYALEHLLQHPRCVRSFGPMPNDEEFDQGYEEPTVDSAIDNLVSSYDEAAHVVDK